MSDIQEALQYQAGAQHARAMLNAGFSIKELRNSPLGKNHSESFENGYYDELAFRDRQA